VEIVYLVCPFEHRNSWVLNRVDSWLPSIGMKKSAILLNMIIWMSTFFSNLEMPSVYVGCTYVMCCAVYLPAAFVSESSLMMSWRFPTCCSRWLGWTGHQESIKAFHILTSHLIKICLSLQFRVCFKLSFPTSSVPQVDRFVMFFDSNFVYNFYVHRAFYTTHPSCISQFYYPVPFSGD
jgi:hypothetical protein